MNEHLFDALDAKRRDAAYQRTTVDEFDALIDFINHVRSVTHMNGPVDALVPGRKQVAADCPIHNAIVAEASDFGTGWTVEAEETVNLVRFSDAEEIAELWPEAWASRTTYPDESIDIDYVSDGEDYTMNAYGGEDESEVRFAFHSEVALAFINRFDDDPDYDFLRSDLGVEELAELLG